MDVLSDVLKTVRLTGSIFFTANLFDPWSILSPTHEELIEHLDTKAECITFFHIITEGCSHFRLKSGETFSLEAGSVVIFPHTCQHVMGSSLQRQPVSALKLNVFDKVKRFQDVKYGGEGAKTQFICGYLLCDQRFNPLIGAMPEVIVLSPDRKKLIVDYPDLDSKSLSVLPNSWFEMTLKHLAEEVKNKNEGSHTATTRLIEYMYIEVLRNYMKNLPEGSAGWLAGLRDPGIGRALKLLHSNPDRKWTVESLAAGVDSSRSAFARRFTEIMGCSPMRYLTIWRMQLAKKMLLQSELNLAVIAERVGYESDVAFNRAFRKNVGLPPIAWRKEEASDIG